MDTPRSVLPAALAAIVLAVGSPGSLAQDAPPPADDPPIGHAEPQMDGARLRTRLASMLEQMEASRERITAAIRTLDEGGDVSEAIDQLGGPMRVRQWSQAWETWNRPDPGERADWGRGEPEPPRDIGEKEVMEFLGKYAPELASRIRSVEEEDPRRAGFFITRLTPKVADVLAAQEHDPALADILLREFKVQMALLDVGGRVAEARRSADEAKLEELRAELRTLAAEQVDLRLARREHEIAALAERLDSLRHEAEQQKADRDQLIDEFIERMMEESRWGGPPDREGRRQRRQGRP